MDDGTLIEMASPYVNSNILLSGNDFLLPFLNTCANFVDNPDEADFILALNSSEKDAAQSLKDQRRYSKPIAWWTIEDPNWFEAFIDQARQADYIFTSDEACIPQYRNLLKHDNIFWLPLACSPEFHYPLPLDARARHLVLSGNWYNNGARLWAVRTVLDPLLGIGYTLSLFCYESFMWPYPYRPFWCGEKHYLTTADQYRYGSIVIGMNNQHSGFDGHAKTYMTSMRTFEALACGKPFLSSHSDAYERLGFLNGTHMVWVNTQTESVAWAERLMSSEGKRIAESGRRYVLKHHTYAHRLKRIEQIVLGRGCTDCGMGIR